MIPFLLAVLSACFLALAFSSFNLGIFAWCGLVPLLIALENQSLRRAFFIAYLCGVVFWGFCVYWLVHVTLLGQIILILYLALYFGIFGGVIYFSRRLGNFSGLFFAPAAWVLLEYLRSYLLTGSPWALIGLSQYRNLPVIQIADLTGAWGVSFLVVLVNIAVYLFLRRLARTKITGIILLVLSLVFGYGFIKLNSHPPQNSNRKLLKVAVIQGNIPQDLKWDSRAVAFIQGRYRQLTQAAAAEKPDLIIWPESSVPGLWGRDEAEFMEVFSLAAGVNTYLLAGAVSYFNQSYFNSALLINPAGLLAGIYSKLHLVPFGEYIPLKNILPFLETIVPIGDITPGKDYTVFKQPADFGVLICFEDLFPRLSREFVRRGAKFLVNITNDAWYKEGSASYQHFSASVFRAVENRVYLARAANTGISGFIDPAGRSLGIIHNRQGKQIFVQGYSSQNIGLTAVKPTFYNRYGDFFVAFCLLLDACVIIIFRLKNIPAN